MKPLGYIVTLCLICAAVKAVALALALAIILAVVVGACTRPQETFGLLAFALIANLVETHPLPLIATIAAVSLASLLWAKRGGGD